MKIFNKFLNKNILTILVVFLLSQPLLDIITSVCLNYLNISFTIGMIIRFSFLALAIYYMIFISSGSNKIMKKYLLALALFILTFLTIVFIKDISIGFLETKNVLKVFYFIFILLFLYYIKGKFNSFNYSYLNIVFLVYVAFIFVPNIFGGLATYEYAKMGNKGLFNSANEVGAIISLLFPIFLYSMLKSKRKWIYFIPVVIYIYVILTIGTKVPVFAFAITLLVFILYFLINIIKTKATNMIVLSTIAILIIITAFIMIIPRTTFYKNIKTHMNYFDIYTVKDVFKNFNTIDNIIFSERLSLIKSNFSKYKNVEEIILGRGYYEKNSGIIEERKTIEIDYLDIFVSYGVLGFLLWVAPVLLILKKFLSYGKKLGESKPLFYSLYILIFTIALFSGHVFTAPAVSLYVALILIMSLEKERC